MKRSLSILTGCLLSIFSISAQDIENQKETLKRIWIVHIVMNAQNAGYIAPAAYKINEDTKNIEGQNYYCYDKRQYEELNINFTKGNPLKALYRSGIDTSPSDVTLTWENGELSTMKEKFKAGTYRIQKEGNNYTVYKEEMINSKLSLNRFWVEMNGDKILKIERYMMQKKKDFLFYVTTYTYPDENTVSVERSYSSDIKGNAKNADKMQPPLLYTYKIENENKVSKENNYYGKNTFTYNESGYVIEREENNKGKMVVSTFEYIDSNMSKTISEITEGGTVKREIMIEIEAADIDKSKPEWEWREGFYELNQGGELIYESRNGLYRRKIDGVWSEWRYHTY